MCCVHAGVANNCSCGARQLTCNATTVGHIKSGVHNLKSRIQSPESGGNARDRVPGTSDTSCDTISISGAATVRFMRAHRIGNRRAGIPSPILPCHPFCLP